MDNNKNAHNDLQESSTKLDDENKQTNETDEANYIGVFLSIGAGLGVTFGIIFDNIAIGISLGTSLGVAIGAVVGSIKNKK